MLFWVCGGVFCILFGLLFWVLMIAIYEKQRSQKNVCIQQKGLVSLIFNPGIALIGYWAIDHVRYINLPKWLRCFQLFSLYPSLFWELKDTRNFKNLQFWPESIGSMLEYWCIERGLSCPDFNKLKWYDVSPRSNRKPALCQRST